MIWKWYNVYLRWRILDVILRYTGTMKQPMLGGGSSGGGVNDIGFLRQI